MNFKVLSDTTTQEEYIYLAITEKDFTIKEWGKLLQRLNYECRICGYERILIDLSDLTVPDSVATVYRAASSPIAIKLLPFHLAWVNCNEDWMTSWKSLELVMRNQSLPWRSFSNRESAEIWLNHDQRASLKQMDLPFPVHLLPTH